MMFYNKRVVSAILISCIILGCTSKNPKELTFHPSTDVLHYAVDSTSLRDSINRVDTTNSGGDGRQHSQKIDEQLLKDIEKQELAKKVQNLLVFYGSDTMLVGEAYFPTLAIARDKILEEIENDIKRSLGSKEGKAQIVDTTMEIGSLMRATLTDDSPSNSPAFEISPMNGSDLHAIDNIKNKTFWQWKVSPLKEGKHELVLNIEVVSEQTKSAELPTRRYPIVITTVHKSFISGLGSFFNKNWQWMITAVCVPLFLAWYTTRLKHQLDQKKSQAQPVAKKPGRKKKGIS